MRRPRSCQLRPTTAHFQFPSRRAPSTGPVTSVSHVVQTPEMSMRITSAQVLSGADDSRAVLILQSGGNEPAHFRLSKPIPVCGLHNLHWLTCSTSPHPLDPKALVMKPGSPSLRKLGPPYLPPRHTYLMRSPTLIQLSPDANIC
jgi:hypothetical protein